MSMTDTCWLTVTVRDDQVELFRTYAGQESYSEGGIHNNQLTYEEANLGMWHELNEAAARGCEFYGYHTPGAEYGSTEFFTSSEVLVEIPTGFDGAGYVVTGVTPEQRLQDLVRLEQVIKMRELLIRRLHDPLFDLVEGIT